MSLIRVLSLGIFAACVSLGNTNYGCVVDAAHGEGLILPVTSVKQIFGSAVLSAAMLSVQGFPRHDCSFKTFPDKVKTLEQSL